MGDDDAPGAGRVLGGWGNRPVRPIGPMRGQPSPGSEQPPPAAPARPATPVQPAAPPQQAVPAQPAAPAQASPAATAGTADKAPEPAASAGQSLGEEDRAYAQTEIRRIVADAMRTYGARDSGAYIVGGTVRTGPVAGRDINIFGQSKVLFEQVSAARLMEVTAHFVRPGGIDEAATMVAQTGLTVLTARRRWGLTTAALWLLGNARGSVYELRTDELLTRIRADELPEHAAILLDGLSAPQAAALRLPDLQALSHVLAERDSRLVLAIDSQTRVDASIIGGAVALSAPPDCRDVVRRHVQSALRAQPTAAVDVPALLAQPDVERLLGSVTEANFDILQLAQLGRDLADMMAGRITTEEVESRFSLRSQQTMREWLDGLTEPGLALTVSLAALHGLPNDAVATAAKRLEDALAAERGGHAVRGRPEPRHVRLAAARAVVGTEVRRTRYGRSEVEVVRFLDSSHPVDVLHYFWHDYDTYRTVVMRWLSAVADAPEDQTARIRAATTIGLLACFSFDDVRQQVIAPWAAVDNPDKRERAVAALALPARNPNTRAQVVRMVREWAVDESQYLRLTAARALGISVGEVIEGGPDELLSELAQGADQEMGIALGDSIAELIDETPEGLDVGRTRDLLAMVLQWAKDRRGRRDEAGAVAFLEIASTLVTERGTDDETPNTWPTLLALTDRSWVADEALRESIIEMWAIVMLLPDLDVFVRRILRRWARAAEENEAMRAPFVTLWQDAVQRRPRLATTIMHHAKRWRGDGRDLPDAPEVAARLLHVLNTL